MENIKLVNSEQPATRRDIVYLFESLYMVIADLSRYTENDQVKFRRRNELVELMNEHEYEGPK